MRDWGIAGIQGIREPLDSREFSVMVKKIHTGQPCTSRFLTTENSAVSLWR